MQNQSKNLSKENLCILKRRANLHIYTLQTETKQKISLNRFVVAL